MTGKKPPNFLLGLGVIGPLVGEQGLAVDVVLDGVRGGSDMLE